MRWYLANSEDGEDVVWMLSLVAMIGLGVTGVTLYMFITENLSQYAVLSAMRAEAPRPTDLVCMQARLCGFLGREWGLVFAASWAGLSYCSQLPFSHDVVRAPGGRHGGRADEYRGRGVQRLPRTEVAVYGLLRTTLGWPSVVLRSQKSQMGQGESRNLQARSILHRFFELGILIKGVDGGLELIGGLLLVFLSPVAINRVVFFFLQGELKEDPTDSVANLLLRSTRSATEVRVPASLFLIVHGIVKLVLVGGLATNRLWSYPAAILVFAGFTLYQLYQLGQAYSLFLAIVTVLDVVVIFLVIAEYRHMRRIATTLKL